MNWHYLPNNELYELLGTDVAQGLSEQEAQIRIERDGRNELEEKKKRPAWLLFLDQFKDFMILILVAAAIISGLLADITDTVIILVIVVLNAIIGFVQEYRAEKAMEALKKMAALQTEVRRNGKNLKIPAAELVTGDVVLLEAGNTVPADIRLIEAHSLRINESALTGESAEVDKISTELKEEHLPLGDRFNMAFKGTAITNGRGVGLVVATGMGTEIGKIARMLQEEESITPLQKRMGDFGKKLTYIVLIICVLLFVSGLIRGEKPIEMLLLSISLAVAAIPEALPALITIALARGASRLVAQNALVRRLPAVETLGSVSFICSDKTGTLTINKMTVVQTFEQNNLPLTINNLHPLRLSLILNHDVKQTAQGAWAGDSTEIALVEHIQKQLGSDAYQTQRQSLPRIAELPFDSDRKCMSSVHQWGDKFLLLSKGAVESITLHLAEGQDKDEILEMAQQWASQGQRVLAFGYRILDALPQPFDYEHVEKDLLFSGLVGMIDPPREEAKQAIAECKSAGIKPVMITGDHPATAAAIANQIGILEEGHKTITGLQLQALSKEEFEQQVEQIRVYARVSPEQKLNIVKALQARGNFVSMTGDGVNDAPSLKAANIGVAMGITGTDVSKEAAHIILLDDNFATIVKAVKEGRRIYDNIRKFIKYIMACNGAEIWTIFMAPLIGLPAPLLPIHILWINLVTDGLPGLALASEKAEPDIMRRLPRKADESLFSDGIALHILWVGILMAVLTLGVQTWAIYTENPRWQTMVFTVLSLSQLAHVMSIRSERTFLYRQGIFSNSFLLLTVLLTVGLQMGVIYLPFANHIFETQPLTLMELGVCFGLAAILFHAVELEKLLKKWRR